MCLGWLLKRCRLSGCHAVGSYVIWQLMLLVHPIVLVHITHA